MKQTRFGFGMLAIAALIALATTTLPAPAEEPAEAGQPGCCRQGKADSAGPTGGCGGCGREAGKAGRGATGTGRQVQAGSVSHHDAIQFLLEHHAKILREVELIEGGVRTVTLSTDNALVDMIRLHVRQMEQRLSSGHGMRHWDPLFVALFENHDAIEMEIIDVPGGVEVLETSGDPEVVRLIRQHAERAVSEFTADGFERAHEPTPMPEGRP